jgi:hypothetical protein
LYCYNSDPSLTGCIAWNDYPQEICFDYYGDESVTIYCSDIDGGEQGIWEYEYDTVYWLENNINTDPLFCDPESGDFRLQLDSPCRTDVCGFMGYTGETCDGEGVGAAPRGNPAEFYLAQNYPNPFNSSTTIEYSLATPGEVTLSVYNIQGQLVEVIQDGYMTAGQQVVHFDGSKLPSGIYFYTIETDDRREGKRMVLLK